MIYGLLGDLEVHQDGKLVELPGGPTLMLLAGLLINANRRMSKADLMRVAWDGGDVKEAQLHKRVMAVRDTLAEIGRRDDIKTHARFGYELRVAEDDVDSLLFQRHIREADEAAAAGDTDAEVSCLRRALALWRGPRALSNAYSDALRQDILALEQRHKRAAVRLFSLELDRGNPEGILDEAARVAVLYPADRRLCEQLMRARHQCGHLVDAAAAYERYTGAVEAETGAAPDPLLRALHFAIAAGDERAVTAAESALSGRARTPTRRPPAVPRQLPPPADLVGRGPVVDEAARLLRGAGTALPLVVLSGPGGVGKTAAAVRAAHQVMSHFPDGQLFMELHGSSGRAADTSEVLAQFLRALEAPQVPDTKAERLASFRTLLADRRVLVVLDDAADGAQVADLVPGNPRCAVLVTAQRRFPELAGARHLPALAPLDLPDATELFLHMVASAGISSDEPDLEAVERVVALCGGLPLALRIASALRVFDHPRPAAELASRLQRMGPEALEYGDLSVARTIGAGLERLDVRARRLFLGLGQLRLTRFSGWTAAAVLDDGADAGAALSRLAASFMIDPFDSAGRYRFHDLTRDYVRRRALAEPPADPAAVPGRAYRALLTLARQAHARLYGGDFEVVHSTVPDFEPPPAAVAEVDASPLDWFEKERLNIRAAVEHSAELGLTEICWDLAVSAHEFYGVRGYHDDWDATHRVALDACRAAGDPRGEGIVLACLNQPTLVASRRQPGQNRLADLWRATALLSDCGDRHGLAIALRTLANALRRQGHLTRSAQLLAEALGHYTAAGDTVGRWQTLRYIGQINLDLGDPAAAREALEAAELVATGLGGPRLLAQTRYWVGQACLADDDIAGARAAFDAVSDVYFDDMGTGRAYALHGLGCLAVRERAYGAAERHLNAAAAQAREAGDEILEGRVWLSLADLRAGQGRPRLHTAALEHARAAFSACGNAYLEVRALAAIAAAAEAAGDAGRRDEIWDQIDGRYAADDVPARDRVRRGVRPR